LRASVRHPALINPGEVTDARNAAATVTVGSTEEALG
jgi:hypothetical protein